MLHLLYFLTTENEYYNTDCTNYCGILQIRSMVIQLFNEKHDRANTAKPNKTSAAACSDC